MPGPWEKYGRPQNVAPNPLFPGQVTQQQQQIEQNAATLPYAGPKAAADARRAGTEANVAEATAPAQIKGDRARAGKAEIDLETAIANLISTGGASAEQAKSASFYSQARKANRLYAGTGIEDEPQGHKLAQTLLPDDLVNAFTSTARQQSEAARRDFIAASLRYESGAAIPPSEFENQLKRFFPQPGDTPGTVAFKAQLRQNAIDGLRVAGGPAAALLDERDKPGNITASNALPPVVSGPAPEVAAATGGSVEELDPETSAAVDRLIRMGRPPAEIAAFAKSRGYTIGVDPRLIAEAQIYAKQHPEYKGGFTQATRNRSTTLGEQIAGSPFGAGVSAAASAATLGFDDELAGIVNSVGGDGYTEGRDAYNAKKHLLADTFPKSTYAGTAVGSVAPFALAGKAVQAAGLPARLAPAARYGQTAEQAAQVGATRAATLGDMVTGGAYGAGETNENRLGGAALGAAAGGVGNVAGRGAANAAAALFSPSGGKLAPLYEIGVRPSIGQRFGGIVNNLEEKLQSFPFAGDMIAGSRQRARDQFQVGLFNRALGEIGEQLPKGAKPGHDAHAYAQAAFGKAYDAAERGMTAVDDTPFRADVVALQKAVNTLRPESQQIFDKLWSSSVERRAGSRVLAGGAYKDALSELGRKAAAIRSNPSGDHELASAIESGMAAIRANAMRNSPPEAVAAMEAADRGYATLVQIENASKAAGGDAATFTPKQFESAVKGGNSTVRKRGYLAGKAANTELAEAGLRLSDAVSNSGSIDRLIPAAAIGGLGAMSPKIGGAMTLYSLLNAPGMRNLTTAAMAPRGGKAKTLADLIRKNKAVAGTVGSSLGIGFLPSNSN